MEPVSVCINIIIKEYDLTQKRKNNQKGIILTLVNVKREQGDYNKTKCICVVKKLHSEYDMKEEEKL
jgi:hypothetical protein